MKTFIGKLFGFNETIYDLKKDINSLREDNSTLKARITRIKSELEYVILDKSQKPRDDISIDFYRINAVSIEQRYYPTDKYLYTEITYRNPDGRIESTLLCVSDEKHKALVKEFEKYKGDYISAE